MFPARSFPVGNLTCKRYTGTFYGYFIFILANFFRRNFPTGGKPGVVKCFLFVFGHRWLRGLLRGKGVRSRVSYLLVFHHQYIGFNVGNAGVRSHVSYLLAFHHQHIGCSLRQRSTCYSSYAHTTKPPIRAVGGRFNALSMPLRNNIIHCRCYPRVSL